MAREIHKCANSKCNSRGPDLELHQLNPEVANLAQYCIANKRTLKIDEKKFANLKLEASKWRCHKCFGIWMHRKVLSNHYYLLDFEKES